MIYNNTNKFDNLHYYITILFGEVLVRSAPTTFHILDVDDFSKISFFISGPILNFRAILKLEKIDAFKFWQMILYL
jgi:hypothetical protein